MGEIYAVGVLLCCCLYLTVSTLIRIRKAKGRAPLFDGLALIFLLAGSIFLALELAVNFRYLVNDSPQSLWPTALVLLGGSILVNRSIKRFGHLSPIVQDRTEAGGAWLLVAICGAVLVISGIASMPNPLDWRAIRITKIKVPNVEYGGRISWFLDADVQRQCYGESLITVLPENELAIPIWTRHDIAGNASPGRIINYEVRAREPFVVQDSDHPQFGQPVPVGCYRFVYRRGQSKECGQPFGSEFGPKVSAEDPNHLICGGDIGPDLLEKEPTPDLFCARSDLAWHPTITERFCVVEPK